LTQQIDTACTAIAAVVASVSGVNAAPSTPQDNINERVFALTYPMSAELDIGPIGTRGELWNVAVDLLTPHSNTAQNLSALVPILVLVLTALNSEMVSGGDFFGGAIDTTATLRVEFLPFYVYSSVDCIGYRVTLEGVKLMVNL